MRTGTSTVSLRQSVSNKVCLEEHKWLFTVCGIGCAFFSG